MVFKAEAHIKGNPAGNLEFSPWSISPCSPLVVGRSKWIRVPEICLIKCLRGFETLKHHSLKGINHLLSQGERSLAPPLKTKMVPAV